MYEDWVTIVTVADEIDANLKRHRRLGLIEGQVKGDSC